MLKTYLSLLTQFITFKSISTDPSYKGEMQKTAQWLKDTFTSHRFTVDIVEGYDNPIVVAKYTADPSYKTCLIYGHYDVQPANITDGWDSEPFTLTQRENRIYARGGIDNKGQVAIHMSAIFELIQQNKLTHNITFMIEGNEETGSPYLSKFIEDHKDKLKSDLIMVSDGEITAESPVIELGFRGGFNSTLSITTASNDLHSGIYGGAAPSASYELSKILSKLFNQNNQVAIPNFYDDVEPIDGKMNIPFSQEEYTKITGAKALVTEPNIDYYNQTGLRPTLQITGIQSGYVGDGYKNIVPCKATAKINARIVKQQEPQKIAQLLAKFFQDNIPSYVEHTFTITDPYEGIKINIDNQFVKKASTLLEEAYNKKPLYKYSGGGLPVVTEFDRILGKPQVLVPFANEDCAMHGVNENFDLKFAESAYNFSKGYFSQ
jgi:acetylornithine deacetylase/succinyl-diaminopimelate desuccinylase-like protein